MKICVASGKGGTGKTTFAVNLALAAAGPAQLLDCDVEAPNARLFLQGVRLNERVVTLPMPEIDETKCGGCGACSRFCAFNAIVSFGATPVIAPEMCHGCGGCKRLCPAKAIREVERRIGVIERFSAGDVALVQGKMDVGVALATPVIRAVKAEAAGDCIVIDAPPGASCPRLPRFARSISPCLSPSRRRSA
jgi:MinD superfamily P-loop ATPase